MTMPIEQQAVLVDIRVKVQVERARVQVKPKLHIQGIPQVLWRSVAGVFRPLHFL
jgi:hypothetical protein